MGVRIVVAEDSLLVREGIVKLLGSQPDIDIVALCVDLPELLAAVNEHLPDAVLTDIRMPPDNSDEGIVAASILRDRHPGVGVVVLSQYIEPTYALQLFDGGSRVVPIYSRNGSPTSTSSCEPSTRSPVADP